MEGKDVSLLKYQAFITTVECGSFTKAAEKLHYSQSGISRMIKDLENEWKVVLLDRDRNGVYLTSEGMKLLPFAHDVVNSYSRLQSEVDGLIGLKSGIIRIATFSSAATHIVPRIIERFQKDYPGIDYEVLMGDYEEIETWLNEGRVDIGFTKIPCEGKFDVIPLINDPYLAVVPANHRLSNEKVFPINEFENEPFLLLEHGKQEMIYDYLLKNDVHPKVHFATWEDYAIMSMVERGLGISILPKLILKRIPYKIKSIPLSVPLSREIGIIMKDKNRLSAAAEKFLTYIK